MQQVAAGLQFPEGPIAMADGSVVLVEIRRGTLTRVTPDGRRETVAELGGGPNGAAIGPDGAVYVCNNGGAWEWEPGDTHLPAGPSPVYRGGLDPLWNGGITTFEPSGAYEHLPVPDPVTTNICFGGPDMRDAWITLASTGRLFKTRWPRPGLKLPFNA
jgi:sugar lactone lactonase YvrE